MSTFAHPSSACSLVAGVPSLPCSCLPPFACSSRLAFLRSMSTIARATRAATTTAPPTAPPMIAPRLILLEDGDGSGVAFGAAVVGAGPVVPGAGAPMAGGGARRELPAANGGGGRLTRIAAWQVTHTRHPAKRLRPAHTGLLTHLICAHKDGCSAQSLCCACACGWCMASFAGTLSAADVCRMSCAVASVLRMAA